MLGQLIMKTLKASEFKATCLKVMDEVATTGEPVLVTKNGKPVGKLVPHHPPLKSLAGICSAQIQINGDLTESIDEQWYSEL